MNIEKFISKRLDKKNSKKKYSKSISDLCVIAVASSLAIIIISICTGKGLEESIKKNFIDLNGNIIIENYSNSNNEHNIGEKAVNYTILYTSLSVYFSSAVFLINVHCYRKLEMGRDCGDVRH